MISANRAKISSTDINLRFERTAGFLMGNTGWGKNQPKPKPETGSYSFRE